MNRTQRRFKDYLRNRGYMACVGLEKDACAFHFLFGKGTFKVFLGYTQLMKEMVESIEIDSAVLIGRFVL